MNVCTREKIKKTAPISISSSLSSSSSSLTHTNFHSDHSYCFTFTLCRSLSPCHPPSKTHPLPITIPVAMETAILNGLVFSFFFFFLKAMIQQTAKTNQLGTAHVCSWLSWSQFHTLTHCFSFSVYVRKYGGRKWPWWWHVNRLCGACILLRMWT